MRLKPTKFVPLLRKRAKGLKVFAAVLLASTSLAFAGMAACQAGFLNFPTAFWQGAAAPSGPPYTTSIQQVSITIADGSASNTATITSVDTSKAFIIVQGYSYNSTNEVPAQNLVRVTLTNSTTITATRNTAGSSNAVTVNLVIIDATSSLVSSVQYGTISGTAATSGTATITSVSTSRSAVFFLGNTTTSTGAATSPTRHARVTLTDSTTVTANVSASSTWTASFVVVEFQSAVIQSRQQVADAYTTANSTDTKTISAVTMANTMIAWGGFTAASDRTDFCCYTLQLTSTTNINLVRNGTNTVSRQPNYTVIEFVSGVLNSSVQRGLITLSSASSNTATISSVTTSVSIANYTGFNGNEGGNFDKNDRRGKMVLTNSTTVTVDKQTAGTGIWATGYEIIEFE